MHPSSDFIISMSCRDVSTLPLAPSIIEILRHGGFQHTSDLDGLQPADLSQELKISVETALMILKCASGSSNDNDIHQNIDPNQHPKATTTKVFTAKDMIEKAIALKPIITYCRSMDIMLGGGVCIGQVTEFCGPPGVGKTQICIQLCIDVQLPRLLNGVEGEAVYIDTEGSFMVERAADMITSMVPKVEKRYAAAIQQQQFQQQHNGQSASATGGGAASSSSSSSSGNEGLRFSRDQVLNGIHIFRAHDQTELLAIINHLSSFLSQRPKVKMVVIDSIAFHFRQDLQDVGTRNRVLSALAQTLNDVAHEHSVAVVVTNHITTRIDRGGTGGGAGAANTSSSGRIVPALGELWSHCVTNRVMLQPLEYNDPISTTAEGGHDGGHGMGIQVWNKVCSCALVKSPSRPLQGGQYKLCGDGIRDVGTTASTSSSSIGMVGGEVVRSNQMGGQESSRKRPHQG